MTTDFGVLPLLRDSVQDSIRVKNWYAALALSLALPDVASAVDQPGVRGRKRYIKWCDAYLQPLYTSVVGADRTPHVFLGGADAYALRCAFLHEGSDDISGQPAAEVLDRFEFTSPQGPGRSVHRNQTGGKLQLEVDRFCDDVCQAFDVWQGALKANVATQAQIDRLLVIRRWAPGSVQI